MMLPLSLSLPECMTLKGTFLYSALIQTDLRWHRGFSEALLDYLFMAGELECLCFPRFTILYRLAAPNHLSSPKHNPFTVQSSKAYIYRWLYYD